MAEVATFWARGRLLGDLAPLQGDEKRLTSMVATPCINQGPEAEATETSGRGPVSFQHQRRWALLPKEIGQIYKTRLSDGSVVNGHSAHWLRGWPC